MSEEEKSYINQANLYLEGKSLREIAEISGISHISVGYNLTKKLKEIDLAKYELVMEKINGNKEKSVEDENVRKRVLEAYQLLVTKNYTITEIAAKLSTTESIICRDLTYRLRQLNKIAPEIVTDEMVRKSLETLKNHSLVNSPLISKETYVPEQQISIYLNKFFPTKEKRMRFIRECIFTFGLRLNSVARILQLDPDEAKRAILENSNGFYNEILRVFDHSLILEDEAMNNFKTYFNRLVWTVKNKSQKDVSLVLGELSDNAIKNLKRKENVPYTDEQIVIILKFQLKYLLSSTKVSEMVNISAHRYANRVRALQDKYPELVAYFEDLCAFYKNLEERKR